MTDSQSSAGDKVPNDVVAAPSSPRSQVSALSSDTLQRRRLFFEEKNALTLTALADVPTPDFSLPKHRRRSNRSGSPEEEEEVIELTATEEEDEFDLKCREENAGASDSEDDPVSDLEIDEDDFGDDNPFRKLENRGAEIKAEDFTSFETDNANVEQEPWCYGAPLGWKPTEAPTGWKRMAPKVNQGEPPSFDDIDNPGNWGDYVFQPKFTNPKDGPKKYKHHSLPSGASPVPKNASGKRVSEGWNFTYTHDG